MKGLSWNAAALLAALSLVASGCLDTELKLTGVTDTEDLRADDSVGDVPFDTGNDLIPDQVAGDQHDALALDLVSDLEVADLPSELVGDADVADLPDEGCQPQCAEKSCGDGDGCGGWCDLPADCEDTNVCTQGICTAEGCVQNNVLNSCDDGTACTTEDSCVDGVCKGTLTAECELQCGNGVCQSDTETALSCPVDCGPCGDGVCSVSEFVGWWTTCPKDCATGCGDGLCEPLEIPLCQADCSPCGDGFCGLEESPSLCAADCASTCGNGLCTGAEDRVTCLADCQSECGDDSCDFPEGPISCPGDCTFCPDGWCTGDEDATSCPDDCATPPCGNGLCDGLETPTACPVDCGSCGDGTCGFGETGEQCPGDCSAECGDMSCQGGETVQNCAWDCTVDSDLDETPNFEDNCPFWYNWDQADSDGDSVGDECEDNDDGDKYPDVYDNCTLVANPEQVDSDGDWRGDACDDDDDNDETADTEDCEPLNPDVHPGALEVCNGVDDDCANGVDVGEALCPGAQLCSGGICSE